jgi:hypothetical protein
MGSRPLLVRGLAAVAPLVLLGAATGGLPSAGTGRPRAVDVDRAIDRDPCLARDGVQVLEGSRARFPGRGDALAPGSTVDARAAWWTVPAEATGAERHPVVIRTDSEGVCFVGGHVRRENDHDTTPWSVWHGSGGLSSDAPGFAFVGTTVENVGDGFAFWSDDARDWTLREVHVRGAHDDCVENDSMHAGRIERSLFDGCFVFYSARGAPGSRRDGGEQTVRITDSLVRMKAMPQVYDPERYGAVGHGPVFKLGNPASTGRSPRLEVHDTIIRMNEAPAGGTPDAPTYDDGDPATPPVPYIGECSGNTIVWTGEGPFPGDWPDCFSVTTDTAVWDEAVASWEDATGRSARR